MTNRKLLDARETRFLDYIKEKRVTSEIATREGMEDDYVRKERIRLAHLHGLKLPKKGQTQALDLIPFGLDDESRLFRGRVADRLHDQTGGGIGLGKYHPAELASLIGVPQKAQNKARVRPFAHDWTLGQIQRLAKLEGKTFTQFMRELVA